MAEDRRNAIMKAARASFLEHGYQATSLDHIIAKVGGSRRNIYALFGDKEGLFVAVLKAMVSDIVAGFDVPPPEGTGPRECLTAIGVRLLSHMTDTETVAAFRQFIAVSGERPDIGAEVHAEGPRSLYRKLAQYLASEHEGGRLQVPDPETAGRIFLEMVKGGYEIEALMTGHKPVPKAEIEAHVAMAVDIFLQGTEARRRRRKAPR